MRRCRARSIPLHGIGHSLGGPCGVGSVNDVVDVCCRERSVPDRIRGWSRRRRRTGNCARRRNNFVQRNPKAKVLAIRASAFAGNGLGWLSEGTMPPSCRIRRSPLGIVGAVGGNWVPEGGSIILALSQHLAVVRLPLLELIYPLDQVLVLMLVVLREVSRGMRRTNRR